MPDLIRRLDALNTDSYLILHLIVEVEWDCPTLKFRALSDPSLALQLE